jgi:hypothetical protein
MKGNPGDLTRVEELGGPNLLGRHASANFGEIAQPVSST